MIATNLLRNSKKQEPIFQQVGSLKTKDIFVFCL